MKKITIATALAFAFNLGFAQNNYSPDKIRENIEKSNAEIAAEKTAGNYKTWFKRAETFATVVEAPLAGAYIGMSEKEADLLVGKPTSTSQVDVEGKQYTKLEYPYIDLFFEAGKLVYWNIKDVVVPNALITGFDAIEKGYSLDPKSTKKAKELFLMYKNYFLKEGGNYYSQGNKAAAAIDYKYAYLCTSNTAVNAPDTAFAYYTAFSALEAKDFKLAAEYAQICIEKKCFQNGDLYKILGEAYAGLNEPQKAKDAYLKGIEIYPANTSIIFGIINLYMSQNEDPKNVLPYLDKAIELDPKNPSLYFVKGTFYEKFKEYENALVQYKKTVEINPNYVAGWVNLGVVYYNMGVEFITKANGVDMNDTAGYDKFNKLADGEFKQSLEMFLKAYQIEPKDKFVVENIKNIYFRFRNENDEMMNNYKKFNEMLQAM